MRTLLGTWLLLHGFMMLARALAACREHDDDMGACLADEACQWHAAGGCASACLPRVELGVCASSPENARCEAYEHGSRCRGATGDQCANALTFVVLQSMFLGGALTCIGLICVCSVYHETVLEWCQYLAGAQDAAKNEK